ERHVRKVTPREVNHDRTSVVAGAHERACAADLDVVPLMEIGEEASLPELEAFFMERGILDSQPAQVLVETVGDVVRCGARARGGGDRVALHPSPAELVEDGDDPRAVVHQSAIEVEDHDGRLVAWSPRVDAREDRFEELVTIPFGESLVEKGRAQW